MHIKGGHELSGTIKIGGAKNSTVALIPASILSNGISKIYNVPQISDIEYLVKILELLGVNEELKRINETKKVRVGHGKMRNRRYKLRRGPLIVYDNGSVNVVKASRNIPGVEVCHVDRLNLLQLCPGGHLGRFVIWTKDAFEKLMVLPVYYFDFNKTGDIISKMNYDIDTVNTSLSSDLIQICTSIITVVGSFIMMITISWKLVGVFLITIPISLLFTRMMLKRTHKMFKKRSQSLGELNAYAEEMITGMKTIKAYGKEGQYCSRCGKFKFRRIQIFIK